MGRRNKLLELSRGFVKGWLGNVGHEDVGAFFGEEDACFETDAAVARESACDYESGRGIEATRR